MKMTFALIAAVGILLAGSASAVTLDFVVTDISGTVLSGQFTTSGPVLQGFGESVTGLTATLGAGALNFAQTGAATLIANPNADGSFKTSPSVQFNYDNLYDCTIGANQTTTGFNNNGLLFSVGGQEYNLFSNGTAPYMLYAQNGVNESVTFSTAVPEPAAWALMLVGFGLAGGAMRLRRQVALAV